MLSDDQNDQPERTESETPTPGAGQPAEAAAPATPVVTRRTRKAPAKKSAAAPAPSTGDTPGDATSDASSDAAPEAGDTDAPVVRKTTSRRAPAKKAPARKSAAKKTAATPEPDAAAVPSEADPVDDAPAARTAAKKSAAKAPARKTAAKRTAKKAAAAPEPAAQETAEEAAATAEAPAAEAATAVLFQAPVVTTTTRRTRKKAAPAPVETVDGDATQAAQAGEATEATEAAAPATAKKSAAKKSAAKKSTADRPARKRSGKKAAAAADASAVDEDEDAAAALADAEPTEDAEGTEAAVDTEASTEASPVADTESDAESADDTEGDGEGGAGRRRRRRGGRRRRKSGEGDGEGSAPEPGSADTADDSTEGTAGPAPAEGDSDATDGTGEGTSRRRRRRRRAGDEGSSDDAEPNTVTRVRKTRSAEDQITSVQGSTRLEAKKQRRREGREAGRRRAPIVSEAEFLARRESVERVMVIRQRQDLIQIGVLEDKVLVEHYVARESQTSLIGNVYLGRVQNVLPSMEAAFIDIGKGRNAVLYAGEVNWQSLGHKEGQPRKIESVLSSGQMVLVQVTKDPVGHKGARLTSQVSLAGRFLVYVPDGTTSGISRKLPDTERSRLKTLLKEIVPDTAGVIVRTAAEGASEDELTRDVERLKARWEDIEKKATHKGSGPQLLYGEPDLTLKVVRDLFTEDFAKLVIEGDDAWDTVHGYVESVAPDLAGRLERFERGATGGDVFATYRIDEQIQKGLDRKVWLPSGGSLIIDRTEAMTVVDVNTGKFTGSGGNLEETVTKNNLEAAEEIVRQLRLRDIGGIIVVDFIDMVLESNRDLVVRRLVECLGRDRTRHQVAEVTSLGLVQMTRKRIGTGLVEAFSENCEHCHGRGVVIKDQPVDPDARSDDGEGRRSSKRRGRRGAGNDDADNGNTGRGADARTGDAHHAHASAPSPKDVAAMARHDRAVEEASPDASEVSSEPSGDARSTEPAAEKVADAPRAEAPPAARDRSTEPADDKLAETVADKVVEQAAEAPPAEPEKPRVVTRTRRRSASRPAGPPSGVTPVGVAAPAASDAADGGSDSPSDPSSGGPGESPVVEHVPIKKKGSRKR
ncbi:Rne/Rng family ribonuclease [Nocardioides sp. GCM10028917]|uniref:Rne/Rng family ribonuclease n=1 Tax=Nocardioides sp. GCM10028917 TaxID=3273408 RepID=UPI0036086503